MTAAFDSITHSLLLRPMAGEDENFIYNSWLKSFWTEGALLSCLGRDVYFPRHHKVIERLLDRAATRVLIASLKEDEGTILGYLVSEGTTDFDVLHYCYVKGAFLRFGIATALLDAAKFDFQTLRYTHQPRAEWLGDKTRNWIYDPYLL